MFIVSLFRSCELEIKRGRRLRDNLRSLKIIPLNLDLILIALFVGVQSDLFEILRCHKAYSCCFIISHIHTFEFGIV